MLDTWKDYLIYFKAIHNTVFINYVRVLNLNHLLHLHHSVEYMYIINKLTFFRLS